MARIQRIPQKIERIAKTLPKTGTTVIKFFYDGRLVSKNVIIGRKNPVSCALKSFSTNYDKNGKPETISFRFHQDTDAMWYRFELSRRISSIVRKTGWSIKGV